MSWMTLSLTATNSMTYFDMYVCVAPVYVCVLSNSTNSMTYFDRVQAHMMIITSEIILILTVQEMEEFHF